MSLVYLNGQYVPREQATVSVMDRGFLFGDGVYEVIPVYGGQPLRLEEHLVRLESSLAGIQLDNPHSKQDWIEIIETFISHHNGGEQSLYLQVTRGAVEKRDHAFPAKVNHTVFLMSNPLMDVPPPEEVKGVSAVTLEDIRWQLCHLKTVSLLGNVLLKQEALNQGYDETILVRGDCATECSASNLFMVKDNVVITPPKSQLLLPGITRDLVLDVIKQAGIHAVERDIQEAELVQADELWFSSSTKAVVPIISLNGHAVGTGCPSEMWRTVVEHYRQYIQTLKGRG